MCGLIEYDFRYPVVIQSFFYLMFSYIKSFKYCKHCYCPECSIKLKCYTLMHCTLQFNNFISNEGLRVKRPAKTIGLKLLHNES